MISKMSIYHSLLLVILTVCALGNICEQPQKQFYLSYNAIGNREYLQDMFEKISGQLPRYNWTYNDKNGSIYTITNLHPHFFYSAHQQVESYHDQYQVNVTLGQLYLTFRFDYQMQHEQKNSTGWARGRVLVDQNSFLKRIIIVDGALQWDPVSVPRLTVSSQLSLEYENPKLRQQQAAVYVQLLNDHIEGFKIKEPIIQKANEVFATQLKQHLNQEQIIKNATIPYSHNGVTLNFTHVVKDFRMNNMKTKGLEVFMRFGLEEQQQNCTQLPQEFDEATLGGVQEIYSMSSIKASVTSAIMKGLVKLTLDKNNEVPYFQFYMGDLGNFVQYANTLPAHDAFLVNCDYSKQFFDQLKVSKFGNHDIYVSIPMQCHVNYQNKDVLQINFDANIVVRLIAQDNSLTAIIYDVGLFGDKYKPIDPKFQVTDTYAAKYAVIAVLQGFKGRRTFGSGFPALLRKYPAIRITDNYAVIFDASEK